MIFLILPSILLLVIVLVLFCDLVLKLEYKEELRLTLYLFGIPLDVFKLISFFRRRKAKEKKSETTTDQQKQKKYGFLRTVEDLSSFVCAILRAVRSAAESLQKHLKIRVHRLLLTVACDDAAKTAMRYGEVSGLLESLLSLCEEHSRLTANYDKIQVSTDFSSDKTRLDLSLTLAVKPLFLLTAYTGAYVAFLGDFTEMPEPKTPSTPQRNKKGTNK